MTLTLAKAGKTIEVDDEALELRGRRKGYSMAFGARFLKRFIDEHDQAADQRALEGRLALRA